MIAILAPAKKMDFTAGGVAPGGVKKHLFPEKTEKLVSLAVSLGLDELKNRMKISDSLAEKTIREFEEFSFGENKSRLKAAALAFKGDTYKGLDADVFSDNDLAFAEERIRILSGLYGLLSPLTHIEPYRFEMGLRIEVDHFKKISDFWKESVTDELNRLLSTHKEHTLINLASAEYMAAVDKKRLGAEVIDVAFHEEKEGGLKTISTYSKKARGMMARFIVLEKIEVCSQLKHFTGEGYRFREDLSGDNRLVFVR